MWGNKKRHSLKIWTRNYGMNEFVVAISIKDVAVFLRNENKGCNDKNLINRTTSHSRFHQNNRNTEDKVKFLCGKFLSLVFLTHMRWLNYPQKNSFDADLGDKFVLLVCKNLSTVADHRHRFFFSFFLTPKAATDRLKRSLIGLSSSWPWKWMVGWTVKIDTL